MKSTVTTDNSRAQVASWTAGLVFGCCFVVDRLMQAADMWVDTELGDSMN